MKFLKTLSIIFLFLSLGANAQDQKDKKSGDQPKSLEDKIYSEKDFYEKLNKEVELRLQKLKRHEIVKYSRELINKEYQIKVLEKELENKTYLLGQGEQDLEKKMGEFKKSQENFLSCVDKVEKDKEKRIGHMVDALSGMKPDAAAQVLSVQDASIAVKLIGMLDSVKVSKIFNKMDKEVSARLQKQFLNMQK
ncbi:MAG: hypothetical protein ACPGJV_12855 [Bacteriovoracaceae bacterium]